MTVGSTVPNMIQAGQIHIRLQCCDFVSACGSFCKTLKTMAKGVGFVRLLSEENPTFMLNRGFKACNPERPSALCEIMNVSGLCRVSENL